MCVHTRCTPLIPLDANVRLEIGWFRVCTVPAVYEHIHNDRRSPFGALIVTTVQRFFVMFTPLRGHGERVTQFVMQRLQDGPVWVVQAHALTLTHHMACTLTGRKT
jgi:hypothetical protein